MSSAIELRSRVVLAFPGQGSYSRSLLRELYTSRLVDDLPFVLADSHTRRMLGVPFLPLVEAAGEEEHNRLLAGCPDLDQVGIFLAGSLVARALIDRGCAPGLLLGHSFGDLAALASADVFSIEDGVRIVCQRVLALRAGAAAGRMAALSCDPRRARELLREVVGEGDEPAAEVAVVNHRRQTVVSGPAAVLERLALELPRRGVSLTWLKSRYPFHSSHLQAAVVPFEIALRGCEMGPPRIPVALSTEGRLVTPDDDLPALLSAQFVNRLDFPQLLESVIGEQPVEIVECGVGVLRRILMHNLGERATVDGVEGSASGLGELLARRGAVVASSDARREQSVAPALTQARRLLARACALLAEVERRPPQAPTAERRTSRSEPKVASALAITSADGLPQERAARRSSQRRDGQVATPPVAVVSMGCVLPGAGDPEQFWRNLESGRSGIVDLAELDPIGSGDFLAESGGAGVEPVPVSDKSYTLLNGAIPRVDYSPELVAGIYDEPTFARLTKGQQLLAVVLAQCLRSGVARGVAGERMRCILGATADGFAEYDEVQVLAAMEREVRAASGEEAESKSAIAGLEELLGRRAGGDAALGQHRALQAVVERQLPGVRSYVVDTACSSSLYSINLGIKELGRGSADLILAGGVFAPGPANNALFAQFRGLTPNASRPFDAAADGVVFGDGAAIVALCRLDDALARGDRILAVIRAMGLSSDGKSPSINVPRSEGQSLAMRRAYESSGIEPRSVQYLEAHATATPVGDAVEFRSLLDVFGPSSKPIDNQALPPIGLGSVKALIGHTGWVSGVASLIKIIKALEHRTLPPQCNFESPHPQIELAGSPFDVATSSGPWPANADGEPRRAAINGFGFGGTNAHLVVEEPVADYHRDLSRRSRRPSDSEEVVVVATAGLFPDPREVAVSMPGSAVRFARECLQLPPKKILLPDVTEHMDASQFLSALAAARLFEQLPGGLDQLAGDVGVVLGLESKTERGIDATTRVFLDRLRRRLAEGRASGHVSEAGAATLEAAIDRVRERVKPSGPYSLPGLMPNIAASRISSLYDLKGPNLVVDSGVASLGLALEVGGELLRHGDCRLVLAGGVNALGGAGEGHCEAVVLLALALPETAAAAGWPVMARLRVEPAAAEGAVSSDAERSASYRGAAGGVEVLEALSRLGSRRAADGERTPPVEETWSPPDWHRTLRFTAPTGTATGTVEVPAIAEAPAAEGGAGEASAGGETAGAGDTPRHAYDFVAGTPIYRLTPRLVAAPASRASRSLSAERLLVLTDQPEWWRQQGEPALAGRVAAVVAPADAAPPESIAVDLTSEESAETALAELESIDFDSLLVMQAAEGTEADGLLLGHLHGGCRLLDLLFVVARSAYERLQAGRMPVVALGLGAGAGAVLTPASGLYAGFLKSLARELPELPVRAISTDDADVAAGLKLIESELAQSPAPIEIVYRGGARLAHRLEPIGELAQTTTPVLERESVVVATGGGRGVTAALVEELLERFGCTVIAVGRTDPDELPESLRRMSPEQLREYEGTFYREQMIRSPGQKIAELKRLYGCYQAAHEVLTTAADCRERAGHYEYRVLDINDAVAVEGLLVDIKRRFGRLDLVVHGAGIQSSKQLPKKSLADFRRIVATKLAGLAHLYRSSEQVFGRAAVDFHLLTSAFSYLGNDGQPDYGAANEAMNRLAAAMTADGRVWSSLAWLGWAGIGMTRGSEFAALAARRRLRGVTRGEGRRLFGELMSGRPTTPINVLLADGEIDYYRPEVALSAPVEGSNGFRQNGDRSRRSTTLSLDLERAAFLRDHQVKGIPTLPGALLIGLAAEAAHSLRPDLKILAFEDTSFRRFVRVYPDRTTELRSQAQVVDEDAEGALLKVQLLNDFVHKSGLVLERGAVQTEIFVRMGAGGLPQPELGEGWGNRNGGLRLPDPYVMEGSPVSLRGPFNSMSEVVVGDRHRHAHYRFLDGADYGSRFEHLIPNVIMVDAFWRFGTVQPTGERALSVYVPERCRRMSVFFDYTDFRQPFLHQPLVFSGANPREDGERLLVGPIEARTEDGTLLLRVEDGVCRRFGVIEDAF